MSDETSTDTNCYCGSLLDLAVIAMGSDGLDERVFATLERIIEHGGDQWWLYVSNCVKCSQDWMVAQDERIHDNYYMRRLKPSVRQAIEDGDPWPEEFMTYERVLRLGRTLAHPWTFLDPRSPALVWTAEDLRRERPGISFAEEEQRPSPDPREPSKRISGSIINPTITLYVGRETSRANDLTQKYLCSTSPIEPTRPDVSVFGPAQLDIYRRIIFLLMRSRSMCIFAASHGAS